MWADYGSLSHYAGMALLWFVTYWASLRYQTIQVRRYRLIIKSYLLQLCRVNAPPHHIVTIGMVRDMVIARA